MLQLLSFIVDTINTAWHFVLNMLLNTVHLIRLIPTFTTYTNSLFAWLPQPFFLFATLGLAITVLLFLIGRQT